MGTRTSIYLTETDLARLERLGNPSLPDVLRRGLDCLAAEFYEDPANREPAGPGRKRKAAGEPSKAQADKVTKDATTAVTRTRRSALAVPKPPMKPGRVNIGGYETDCPHPPGRRDRKTGLCNACGMNLAKG